MKEAHKNTQELPESIRTTATLAEFLENDKNFLRTMCQAMNTRKEN